MTSILLAEEHIVVCTKSYLVNKFEFGRNTQKQLGIMCNEIEVLEMFKHRNLIKYRYYWIGGHYGVVYVLHL